MLLVLGACSDNGSLMPTSGGRPYEVLVVGSDNQAVQVVARGLRSLRMKDLPQAEATFDVSVMVGDGLSQATRYARNIVMVTTGIDTLSRPRIGYEFNVYARPQLILHVKAADSGQLALYNIYNVRALEQQLVVQELNNGIRLLREKHSLPFASLAEAEFGIRLWVPENLTKWRRGQDFLWLSNDSPQAMQNICVYRYPGTGLDGTEALRKRDSVMRQNMPGEADGAYMTTVASTVRSRVNPNGQLEMRGLWEMQGDAMGGPFVSLSTPSGDSTLVVEAFVYAPEQKKRNLIRRLEAALHTLNP